MHIPDVINNDMKDSSYLSPFNDLTITAITLPIIALLAIMAGLFISDGSVLAKQSPADTRISADLNESYFTTDSRLAQEGGGLLESRSDQEEAENEEASDSSSDSEEVTSSQCSNIYLEDNLRIDFENDRAEVLKLQSFLKTFENYDYVTLSGVFDQTTLRAVKAFQTRYSEDILEPWGYQSDEPTGYVYITTKKKINEIYCDEQFLLSQSEQAEIREYRQKLNTWRAQGASFETPHYLTQYYAQTQTSAVTQTDDPVSSETDTTTMSSDDDQTTDTDTEVSGDMSTTSDAATDTSTTTDDRGFFERLFGLGDDDEVATTSTSTEEATSTDTADEESEDVATEEMATGTATTSTSTATSGIDQLATGVYNGINGIVNFLLSPTFLLAVLIILILLLIATLIEGKEEDVDMEDDESTDAEVEYAETKGWKSDDKSDSDSDTKSSETETDKDSKAAATDTTTVTDDDDTDEEADSSTSSKSSDKKK